MLSGEDGHRALVEFHPAGYRRAVDRDDVDAHRFVRIAADGQRALAIGHRPRFRVDLKDVAQLRPDDLHPGMLVVLNLFLNVFNLIPVIPLDGGQIMREVISIIIPRYGVWLAYGLSFLLAGTIQCFVRPKGGM